MSRDTKLATGIRADSFSDKGFTDELGKAQTSGFSRGILIVCGAFFLAIFIYIFAYAVKTTYHWHDDRPTAVLGCGPVVGVYDDVNYLVTGFKAIPYGASPTGDKRWQPSTPKYTNGSCWNGTLDATSYGNICYQYGYQTFSANQSEDCLNLDVWTKNLDKSRPSLLPTVVWIHGGRNVYGSSHSYKNLEDFIRNRDVCIVAPNYRLNVFGFLSLSELAATDSRNGTSGNYGITDIILALQWVQNNVKSFGCDPDSVTLMGHGSGGTDVLALYAAPSAKGLFHKAIVLSGSPNITMSRDQANNYNRVFLNNTGCNTTSNLVASCLRSLPAPDLLRAIPNNWLQTSFWPTDPSGLNLPGLVIVDGKTVTRDLFSAFLAVQNEAPLFLSSVKDELELWANTTIINQNATQYNQFLINNFAPWGGNVGQTLVNQYMNVTNVSVARSFYDLSTDLGLLCAHIELGNVFHAPTNIYLSVLNQGPSTPVPVSAVGPAPADPFHLWDFMVLFNSWGFFEASQTSIFQAGGGTVAPFKPSQADKDLGSSFANQIFSFVNSTDGTIPGVTTFNGNPDYPSLYTVVLQGNGNSSRSIVTNYRQSFCDNLKTLALNSSKYWWVN